MKTRVWFFMLAACLRFIAPAFAAVHYVDLTSTNPAPPFTNWATAATNIQDAVSVAQPGEIVLAGDGTYNVGGTVVDGLGPNRVALTNPITLLSLSGPQAAIILGDVKTRCVYVGSNAVLSGFTLTGGQANNTGVDANPSGGGAWCETGGVVSNCVIIGNAATGTANAEGGGIYGGTLFNGTVASNTASYGGGAAFARLVNCTIVTNTAGNGGGVSHAVLSNCVVISNSATSLGGGAFSSTLYNTTLSNNLASTGSGGAESSILHDCALSGNKAPDGGGTSRGTNYNCLFSGNYASDGGGTYLSTDYNCLITGNTAFSGGGAGGGTLYNCVLFGNQATNALGGGGFDATLYNCTVVSNYASSSGGGQYNCFMYNSIIYYNNSPGGSNNTYGGFYYCCTAPLPSYPGPGCFTNAPVFVNLPGGDLHQRANSPTINGGFNGYVSGPPVLTNDLDGNPRITGWTVDIGAYEYQGSNLGLPIPIPWLRQYNLPTDGSADYLDSDSDGMNNWQEWIAGTDPTNAASVLLMSAPVPDGTNIVVTWQSVTNRAYGLERSPGLQPPNFLPLATNIVGQSGTTAYTDTTAIGPGPFFYRVTVQ